MMIVLIWINYESQKREQDKTVIKDRSSNRIRHGISNPRIGVQVSGGLPGSLSSTGQNAGLRILRCGFKSCRERHMKQRHWTLLVHYMEYRRVRKKTRYVKKEYHHKKMMTKVEISKAEWRIYKKFRRDQSKHTYAFQNFDRGPQWKRCLKKLKNKKTRKEIWA